ncbi:MAG: MFS transporter [Planctomycetes bacterium]|nr:MFS transporter [Planctomycetota bacterium]
MSLPTSAESAALPLTRTGAGRQLWLLRIACLLQLLGFGTTFSFEAVWMRDHFMGETFIGSVIFTYMLLILCSGVAWGMLADRTGQAARIACAGCAIFVAGVIWLSFSDSPGAFLAYAFFRGLGQPMILNMMPVLVFAVIGTGETGGVGRGYSLYRIFGSVGFIASSLAFPYLFSGVEWILRAGAAGLILGALPLLWIPPTRRHADGDGRRREVFRNRELLGFLAATFFFATAHPAVYAFLSPYARSMGADNTTIGLLGALMGVVALIALPICGWATDRFGPRRLLVLALLAQPLRALAQSLAATPAGLFPAQFFHFFTWAGSEVAAYLFVTRLVGERHRALGMALYNGALILGMMAGSPVCGYLAEHHGYVAMYRTMSAVASLGLAIFGVLLWRRSRAAPAPEFKAGA